MVKTTTEFTRQERQVTIDAAKTAVERNRLGQFATPYPLAVDIARAVRNLLPPNVTALHFGEPACGSGAFFSALSDTFPVHAVASATGVEIDQRFADTARDLWGQAGLRVVEGDFTDPVQMPADLPRPNIILTNPPYVRHHHLSQDQKQRLSALVRRDTGISVNGLAGLYVYFLLAAHAWLQDGGIAAWLIPSEFMDVNYGVAVKQYLTERVSLITVHRFDPKDVQFDDAMVSSAVVIFRKIRPTCNTTATFSFGGTVTAPTLAEPVSIGDLKDVRKWTSLPQREGSMIRRRTKLGALTLGSLFKIQRGIATGANDYFIMTRDKAAELGLPPDVLRPVLPSPRKLGVTVIESREDGYPILEPQLVLLDTDLSLKEIETRMPTVESYLASAVTQGILDSYLVRGRKLWYRQEQRPRPPFLCTYMGRGKADRQPFRFIWNKSNATATNVYLMLFPKPPLAKLLAQRPELEEEIFRLLNGLAPSDLRGEGRVYGGGMHKIEPNELSAIPALTFAERFPEIDSIIQSQLQLSL